MSVWILCWSPIWNLVGILQISLFLKHWIFLSNFFFTELITYFLYKVFSASIDMVLHEWRNHFPTCHFPWLCSGHLSVRVFKLAPKKQSYAVMVLEGIRYPLTHMACFGNPLFTSGTTGVIRVCPALSSKFCQLGATNAKSLAATMLTSSKTINTGHISGDLSKRSKHNTMWIPQPKRRGVSTRIRLKNNSCRSCMLILTQCGKKMVQTIWIHGKSTCSIYLPSCSNRHKAPLERKIHNATAPPTLEPQ